MTRFLTLLGVALISLAAHPARSDQLLHIGTFTWETEDVVGLSGLELSADGTQFMMVGDRGWLLTGRFTRSEGRITDMAVDRLLPILGNNGLPVAARRVGDWSDAEGLALAADGSYWISFERWAHVSFYPYLGASGEWIEDAPSFYDYSDNRQLEALALHPDGTLYTFPERPTRAGFPIYRLREDGWSIIGHIAERNGFSIVGADFDAEGQLYLLERKLVFGLWWQNRIRRLHPDTPAGIETLWIGQRGQFFNLEGIALWSGPDGQHLTLVSDNNGDLDEPAQFVDFRLVADP